MGLVSRLRAAGIGRTLPSARDAAQAASGLELARTGPRLAVCVAGALRTFLELPVQESFARNFPNADVFHHLFLGTELSGRGQGAEAAPSRELLLRLRNATRGRHTRPFARRTYDPLLASLC